MALDSLFLSRILKASAKEVWPAIFDRAWEICSAPLPAKAIGTEIIRREHAVADIDHLLSTSGWDIWRAYEQTAPLASERLSAWWRDQSGGKAALILDGLSLRECPWLLSQARSRGFSIHEACAAASDLPADTTTFAKALGFSQRASLSNNNAGGIHHLPGARTESAEIAWRDCADWIGAEPSWVFWHHWPDNRLHEYDAPGRGLPALAMENEAHLSGDDFWYFVGRLSTGRRVVITADHGHASSGNFADSGKEQGEYLRGKFGKGRWADADEPGAWVPPLDLLLETRHGRKLFVNGRRKWKSPGGYPTLTHGGLTVLEVAVPWIELSK